jgi:hypothetical protein
VPEVAVEAPTGPSVRLVVDGKPHEVSLSPEQQQAWDEATDEFTRELNHAAFFDRGNSEKAAKTRKAAGFKYAAEKRRITGLLTAREKAIADVDAKKVKIGRTVRAKDGTIGEVVGQGKHGSQPVSFGKVKVKVGDEIKTFPRVDLAVITKPPEIPEVLVRPPEPTVPEEAPKTKYQVQDGPLGESVISRIHAEMDELIPKRSDPKVAEDLKNLTIQREIIRALPKVTDQIETGDIAYMPKVRQATEEAMAARGQEISWEDFNEAVLRLDDKGELNLQAIQFRGN